MKILKWMFMKNTWLWFHILAGGIGAKIGLALNLFPQNIVVLVFCIATAWELIEWIVQNDQMEKIYGSYSRAMFDSFGDILGAVLMAAVVVL